MCVALGAKPIAFRKTCGLGVIVCIFCNSCSWGVWNWGHRGRCGNWYGVWSNSWRTRLKGRLLRHNIHRERVLLYIVRVVSIAIWQVIRL
jgi:hypothetical protein